MFASLKCLFSSICAPQCTSQWPFLHRTANHWCCCNCCYSQVWSKKRLHANITQISWMIDSSTTTIRIPYHPPLGALGAMRPIMRDLCNKLAPALSSQQSWLKLSCSSSSWFFILAMMIIISVAFWLRLMSVNDDVICNFADGYGSVEPDGYHFLKKIKKGIRLGSYWGSWRRS